MESTLTSQVISPAAYVLAAYLLSPLIVGLLFHPPASSGGTGIRHNDPASIRLARTAPHRAE
ncbi:MAG TPA: hypothetical protein VEH31_31885 [Streptosporangiaceae bacterium]|nr:hypothetical protein [Streptosporangiaceae bacterium]